MLRWMILLVMVGAVAAQEPEKHVPKAVPVPTLPQRPMTQEPREAPEPVSPAAQTVTDVKTHLTFHLPAGWNVSRKDGELSTFRLDARTAPRRSQLRVTAALAFNPFPLSTFSGALLYVSTIAGMTASACAAETSSAPEKPLEPAFVGDLKWSRGKDEHGHICTEARDVAYTAMRGGSCLRIDLAVNTFCGGDVSGVEDITDAQLGAVFKRLEGVLETVRFTGK